MRGCQDFKHNFLQLSSWVPGGTDLSWTTVCPPPEKAGPVVGEPPDLQLGRQGAGQEDILERCHQGPRAPLQALASDCPQSSKSLLSLVSANLWIPEMKILFLIRILPLMYHLIFAN